MMFCPHCSNKNPEEAKFCAKCGGALPSASSGKMPQENIKSEDNLIVSPGMKWGILVASIFLPIIGIVLGIIYMQDASAEKKAAGKLWLSTGLIMAFIYYLSMSNRY